MAIASYKSGGKTLKNNSGSSNLLTMPLVQNFITHVRPSSLRAFPSKIILLGLYSQALY